MLLEDGEVIEDVFQQVLYSLCVMDLSVCVSSSAARRGTSTHESVNFWKKD